LQPYRGLMTAALFVILLVMMSLGLAFSGDSALVGKLPIGLGIHIIWWVLP
jgi:hypothetical protein